MAIIGQTQYSGKTTLLKRLAQWAAQLGYKILIFDTKSTEPDYEGFGTTIPVCLRQPNDSFVIIGLLESIFKRKLTQYYATLDRIVEGAKDMNDMIKAAGELEAATKNSWLKDAARTLQRLLARLRDETTTIKTVPTLQLVDGINRMDIHQLSDEAQWLVVKNCFEDALHVYKGKLIIILDEAYRFIPQGYNTPATRAIMLVTTQGAKTGLFVWIATQFLAVTDKDPLKACAVKFLGTQDQTLEVRHTLDLIPEARGKITRETMMRMKVGHWFLVRKTPSDVKLVYAAPVWLPWNIAVQVAQGAFDPKSDAVQQYSRRSLAVSVRPEAAVDDAKNRLIAQLESRIAQMGNKIQEDTVTIQSLKQEADWAKRVRSALTPLLGQSDGPSGQFLGGPSPLSVESTVTEMTIVRSHEPLVVTDKTLQGVLAIIYSEDFFSAWRRSDEVQKRLIAKGWGKDQAAVEQLKKLAARGFLEVKQKGTNAYFRNAMSLKEARDRHLLKEEQASH